MKTEDCLVDFLINKMRCVVECLLCVFGGSLMALGIMFLLWIQKDGYITDAWDESTDSSLVVRFAFESNDGRFSGETSERAPIDGNITLDDLYALHPIGSPITMYANPLFKHNSSADGYPLISLVGAISAFGFAVVFIVSLVMITRERHKYYKIHRGSPQL